MGDSYDSYATENDATDAYKSLNEDFHTHSNQDDVSQHTYDPEKEYDETKNVDADTKQKIQLSEAIKAVIKVWQSASVSPELLPIQADAIKVLQDANTHATATYKASLKKDPMRGDLHGTLLGTIVYDQTSLHQHILGGSQRARVSHICESPQACLDFHTLAREYADTDILTHSEFQIADFLTRVSHEKFGVTHTRHTHTQGYHHVVVVEVACIGLTVTDVMHKLTPEWVHTNPHKMDKMERRLRLLAESRAKAEAHTHTHTDADSSYVRRRSMYPSSASHTHTHTHTHTDDVLPKGTRTFFAYAAVCDLIRAGMLDLIS